VVTVSARRTIAQDALLKRRRKLLEAIERLIGLSACGCRKLGSA